MLMVKYRFKPRSNYPFSQKLILSGKLKLPILTLSMYRRKLLFRLMYSFFISCLGLRCMQTLLSQYYLFIMTYTTTHYQHPAYHSSSCLSKLQCIVRNIHVFKKCRYHSLSQLEGKHNIQTLPHRDCGTYQGWAGLAL